jgi:sortase A
MRTARPRIGWVTIAITALLVACGGDDNSTADTAAVAKPVAEKSSSPAPTSTLPATDESETAITTVVTTTPPTIPPDLSDQTTKAGATTVPDSTVPPTTAAVAALPIPVPAPVDSRGEEPVVELGTLEIPKIGLNTTMYEGIRLTTLDRGPGHWPGTAMPGEPGNVVVAGHRVSHDKPFRNVDKLAPGDQVIFTTPDGRYVYEVTSTEIVPPDAIRIIDQTDDKTATLFACHPPGSTRERIVVHLAFVET